MTPDEFRALALGLPEAVEQEHMNHPDFRVGKRIFATLGAPDDEFGMVRLTPEDQQHFCEKFPGVFKPVPGGWGRQGCTHVKLADAREEMVIPALRLAWRRVAPKKLLTMETNS